MQYRRLGRTGFLVSDIGYGAWGIGGKMWLDSRDDESLRALRRAFELGVNFVDTALVYGDGHSEQLVGQAIKDAPQRIYVATKVPPKNRLWPARPGIPIDQVFPYDYIIECTEQSLRNLGVETIDLQQLHVWNPEWLDADDWRRAAEDLKRSGKIRAFGISVNDHQPDSCLEVIQTGLIDTVQVIYNIFDQSPEQNLFPLCQKLDIGVIARVPLDEGGLTGRIKPDTKFPPGDWRELYFQGDRKRQVWERVQAIQRDISGLVEGTIAEVALRFCLSHPAVSTVIPGMRRVETVESSCSVSDLGPLPENVLAVLRKHAWPRNFYPD